MLPGIFLITNSVYIEFQFRIAPQITQTYTELIQDESAKACGISDIYKELVTTAINMLLILFSI